ncbi:serine/threonine-protein kinase 33 isoform X2 [Epinephelus fuscoguttatus]|uniref:serine/threonine-protein kinase 33 isoform X2 n=1 Tax=Epinephelus fuscoguttatus TaxID=293821 RepID=UPI0020D194A0|nr:serine/threonine-protein kinase 33 isoform X2 [Epinephelus fuscoguttatus]
MTKVYVSGMGMNMVSPWTSRDTLERNVPIIRLKDYADLRGIYEFGRKLGHGSYGTVYEATHIKTQTKWAIKEVCRPAAGSQRSKMLEQELNILKEVNHAHIIHLQEVYHTAKMTYLVTELCSGGDLRQLLQRKKFLTEDETRHVICSVADAVVYLHKRDIVHRDLKLENILVKDYLGEDDKGRINIKVTDFGLSVKTGGVGIENMMQEACGTLLYMAPEMMSRRGYSHCCDVWSIGVIMFMLLCGEPPFKATSQSDLRQEIMNNNKVKYTQPIWATVSHAAKNILTCLLKQDPAYRMSANELLETPWITGDTDVPAMPPCALEMMRNDREQKERTHTLEDLSLTSSEDTLDPSPLPRVASAETDSNCRSHAVRDNCSCTPTTSTKPVSPQLLGTVMESRYRSLIFPFGFSLYLGIKTKERGGGLHLDKCKNNSKQLSTTQASAKQLRPRDKKDVSAGQKPASKLSKADDQRPSTSSKSRTAPRKL